MNIPSLPTSALANRILKPAGWLVATAALVAACGNRFPGKPDGGHGGYGGHHHPRDAGQDHEDGGHDHEDGGPDHEDGGHDHEDGGHDHEDGGHDHEDGGHDHEDGGHDHEDGGHDHEDGGHDHDAGAHSGSTCPKGLTLTYENFGKRFFDTYCTNCHSSQLSGAARNGAPLDHDFDTLEGILGHAHHIDQVAAAGPLGTNERMPPSDPRPNVLERIQLGAWLACETDGDGGSHGTTVTWVVPPPQTVGTNTSFTTRYTVSTDGELHVAELRACQGVVPNCGMPDFDVRSFASADAGQWAATLSLPSAGTWTVVGWIHVDLDPHVSEPVTVTVQ